MIKLEYVLGSDTFKTQTLSFLHRFDLKVRDAVYYLLLCVQLNSYHMLIFTAGFLVLSQIYQSYFSIKD